MGRRPSRLTHWLAAIALCACGGGVRADEPSWTATWYAAPTPSPAPDAVIEDLTLRQIVRTTVGGQALRVRLTNAYGKQPVRIGRAHVARRLGGASTDTGLPITFNGRRDVTIAAGASVLSDPAPLPVAPQSDLAVSLYVEKAPATTAHMTNRSQIYFARGDRVAATGLVPAPGPQGTWGSWLLLSGVDVASPDADGTLVAFGDSITDGLQVDADRGLSWPDRLYDRLRRQGLKFGVANAGITGNRLNRPPQWGPFGTRGLDRFERDVLLQPGVKAVFVLLGINDIGQGSPGAWDHSSAADLQRAYTEIIRRAHARGIKVFLGTLLPFKGAADGYYSAAKDALRQQVNAWIRANAEPDGVFDTDRALADPADPLALKPEYDSGDHLHPGARGAQAIADAVPAAWLDRAALGTAPAGR